MVFLFKNNKVPLMMWRNKKNYKRNNLGLVRYRFFFQFSVFTKPKTKIYKPEKVISSF